jgi:hypothetical protein
MGGGGYPKQEPGLVIEVWPEACPSQSNIPNHPHQRCGVMPAWGTSEQGKRMQAIAMGIVQNLLSLFEAKIKSKESIEDTKVIKAWQKDLSKRAEKARAAGRHLPKKTLSSPLPAYRSESAIHSLATARPHAPDLLQARYRTGSPPHAGLSLKC